MIDEEKYKVIYIYIYIMDVVKYAIWAIDRARTGHVEVLYGPYIPAARKTLITLHTHDIS